MKTFVLVPGAWMGAWAWDEVTQRLNRRGHRVYPMTLTGLAPSDTDISAITPETHINDVIALLDENDLRDVVIAGHTYGGLIAGAVADRVPDRVAHVVLVEALLPKHGKSALDAFPERIQRSELRLIAQNGGRWPVPHFTVVEDGQDVTTEQAKWLADRLVPHPGRTLSEPIVMKRPVTQQRATYVVCEKEHFSARLASDVAALRDEPTWSFRSLDTGLWPMVSAPDELADLLHEAGDNAHQNACAPSETS